VASSRFGASSAPRCALFGPRSRALAFAVAILLALPARADEQSELRGAYAGIGLGTGLFVVAPTIGGTLEANYTDIDIKRGGMYLLTGGLMLAPIVSHLFAREWGRAALFGAIPTAAFVSVVTLLQLHPDIFYDGDVVTRVTYGVMICVSALGSTVGMVDSLGAPGRIRARHRSLAVVPGLVPRGGALFVGGTF
jgi:hypothetical protein